MITRIAKKATRAAAVAVTTVAIVAMTAAPALAEGNFSTTMTQVQPHFDSRPWSDSNRDSVSTRVTLSGCKVNVGGSAPGTTPISSVKVALLKSNGTVVQFITKACGTYDFGRQPAGSYKFRVWAINGNSAKNRQTFLNAYVAVNY